MATAWRWSSTRRAVRWTSVISMFATLALGAGCGSGIAGSLIGGLLGTSVGGGGGLTIMPPAYPVRVGEQRQFRAISSDPNLQAEDLVWQSSGSGGTITPDGLFTAAEMGVCTVWASYRVPSSDPTAAPRVATTNRVSFDIWPRGPVGSGGAS
jgi:hypothetical protein